MATPLRCSWASYWAPLQKLYPQVVLCKDSVLLKAITWWRRNLLWSDVKLPVVSCLILLWCRCHLTLALVLNTWMAPCSYRRLQTCSSPIDVRTWGKCFQKTATTSKLLPMCGLPTNRRRLKNPLTRLNRVICQVNVRLARKNYKMWYQQFNVMYPHNIL